MADTTDVQAIDLEAEATTAPVRELPYRQVGKSAEVVGGSAVFLSRNRKSIDKLGEKAPVYLTAQEGTQQQSIPFRAFAAALTHDVVPMAQVVTRYVKAGRADELRTLLDKQAPAPAPATAPVPKK